MEVTDTEAFREDRCGSSKSEIKMPPSAPRSQPAPSHSLVGIQMSSLHGETKETILSPNRKPSNCSLDTVFLPDSEIPNVATDESSRSQTNLNVLTSIFRCTSSSRPFSPDKPSFNNGSNNENYLLDESLTPSNPFYSPSNTTTTTAACSSHCTNTNVVVNSSYPTM